MEQTPNMEKTYFDVLGLCCSSEVPAIESILQSLDGVKNFSVIVPTKTVIVFHNSLVTSHLQIVKALNRAGLEANVRAHGPTTYKNKWPSPYALISGFLLALSFFKYLYPPIQWLAVGAIAVGIIPIARKAVSSLRRLTIDINILVLIAVSGSIALRDYWEAATIVFLFTIAEWLESRASHKATAVMSSLVSVVPQRAIMAETGEEIGADEVKVNTVLAVKAGEVIPIDGVVVEGRCEVDEKFLTGESFPVAKEKDSIVWASTINLNGYITVRTTTVAEDCVVSRMAQLVEEAQNQKSKTQRVIDKIAKFYTPAIVAISASLALVPFVFRVDDRKQWFHLSLVVLVSGCPCPLLLSTPVATFCALSKAAKIGVLIKGAEHLETLAGLKVMAFDKTGTITRGEFHVSDFRSLGDDVDVSLNTLLFWISSIESKSSHPMADALVEYGRGHGIEAKPECVENFEIFPGEGIYGRIEDNEVYVGNRKIASRAKCTTVPSLEGYDVEGKSVGYVFLGSTLAGIFSLSDTCRTGVNEALQELKSMGIETVMLTGDSQEAAMYAQNQLRGLLDSVHAELLPQDKERIIRELQEAVGPAGMIGDGVNDAPALAAADVGISMGVAGSALATETGDVVLMSNDIRKIPRVVRVARMVRRKIIENVVLSILTKASIVGLAVAGHPLVWAAVMADVGTCLVVIFNSMLILKGISGPTTNGSHEHVHRHGGSKCCELDLESQKGHQHGCCEAKHEKTLTKHQQKFEVTGKDHEEHDHSMTKSSCKNKEDHHDHHHHHHHRHSDHHHNHNHCLNSSIETSSKDHGAAKETKECCKNKHSH